MSILAYEFSLSVRRLMRRPAQSLLMVATLSVSLALSLLGWSLFHTMFLLQPEFDRSGSLYRIGITNERMNGRILQIPRDDFEAWKAEQTVFSDFAPAMLYQSTFVTTSSGIERFAGANISSDLLRMVGAAPLLGRLFTPDEDKLGCPPVILLSEKTWRSRFNADPAIVGQTTVVDGVTATVVGVMPESFRFPNAQEVWQPLGFSPHERTPPNPVMDIVARLKPGVTLARAEEDLQLIAKRRPESMVVRQEFRPVITPFRDYYLHADMHRSAAILFALSLVFILVSCANAANLVMIDFFGRTSEIAASLALGVPRGAAIRGLAFQLFVTAFVAGLIAFAILLAAGPYVHSAMSRITTPYWLLFSLQWHHVGVALLLAFGSASVALLVPLTYVACVNLEGLVRQQSGASRVMGRGVWRRSLMVGQIGLLTVLGVAAGLLLRSSQHVNSDHWGFNARPIFASKTSTPIKSFPTPEIRYTTHMRLVDELNASPSVAAAGLMTEPIGFSGPARVSYAGSADEITDGRKLNKAVHSSVTPDLFATLDIPFIEGETFSRDRKKRDDAATAIPPVVITAGIAERLWPGDAAVGRIIYIPFAGPDATRPPLKFAVRGVLRKFQASGPKAEINDAIYTLIEGGMFQASFLYVRGKNGLPPFDELRQAAVRTDPRMAIYFPNNLQQVIEVELSSVHLTTRLTVAYALAAVLLCIVGIYSITVSQVLQRQREFGIRMALGIEAKRLWVQLLQSHIGMALIGLVVGLGAAAALARVLASLLFGVEAHDFLTFFAVGLVILSVSAFACVPSFFRLNRVNPADCLRSL